MKAAVLIQARSRSTRLPGKCFLPIPFRNSTNASADTALKSEVSAKLDGGEAITPSREFSIVERVFSQVVRSEIPSYFVIPDDDEDLRRHLIEKKLPFLTGPEHDVRERYRKAATALHLDVIVRATADNPFTDPDHIVLSLNRMKEVGVELFSFTDLPLGVAVEVFTMQALMTDTPEEKEIHREHVSLHIKHHPERFAVLHETSPVMMSWRRRTQYGGPLPRLTVDERRDYNTLVAVAERLEEDSLIGLLDLFLAMPGLFEGNRDVEQLRFDRG